MYIKKSAKNSAIFDEKIEIRERCQGVHCVDLGESFPTSIYLQKSASIQPRTSPSKFEGKFNSLFTSLLRFNVVTLTDCTAATSMEGQTAATDGTYGMFSQPMKKDDFIAQLQGQTAA